MGCAPHWEELIQAYIDGELDEKQQHKVEEHLRECSECAAEFQEAYAFQRRLQTVFEGVGTGADFTARVMEAISPEATGDGTRTPVEENLVGRTIAGYKVLSVLGRGGMGTVYKALQLSMEREVALKVLSPRLSNDRSYVERFLREARAAGALNHPNIVRIFDVVREGDSYFFSMELVRGRTVFDIVADEGPMDVERALNIARQVADALAYAHRNGVVHRDIKPENIMLTTDGQVKLTDLGLAKRVGVAGSDSAVTQAGQVMGTPHYMSPEQVLDSSGVDHRTDIYSLGATLYFMLTGERPYGWVESAMEVMVLVAQNGLQMRQKDIQRIPAPVLRLIKRLCAKEPRMRPQTCERVMAEIDATLEALRRPATTDALVAPATERPHRRLWLFGAVAAVAVATIVALIAAFSSSEEKASPQKQPVVSEEKPITPPRRRVQRRGQVSKPPVRKAEPVRRVRRYGRRRVEEVARRALEAVERFIRRNPAKVGEAVRRLRNVAATYAGTEAAAAAREKASKILAELEKDWQKAEAEAERLVSEQRFSDAINVLLEFASGALGTDKERYARRKAEAIDALWRRRSEDALGRAEKMASEGRLKDALAALEAAEPLCHPALRERLVQLRHSLTERLAEEKALARLRRFEEESRLFYTSVKEAMRKLDIETLLKEAEARKSGPAAAEINAFISDIRAIATVADSVINHLERESQNRAIDVLLSGDDEPRKFRVMRGRKPYTIRLKSASMDYEISVFRLDKGFFEARAREARVDEKALKVAMAYMEFVRGEIERAKDLFEEVAPGFKEALKKTGTPSKPYEATAAPLHYARVWRTLATEIAAYARERQIKSAFAKLERLVKKRHWDDADALISHIKAKWGDILPQHQRRALEKYAQLVARKLSSRKSSRVLEDETLAFLRKILHAASIERKRNGVYVITYDFSTKEQLKDWLYNHKERGERFIDDVWASLARNRRLGRKINTVTAKRWELIPRGRRVYLKLHDCTITLPVVFEGNISVEYVIEAVSGWGIQTLICDSGDYYYAAAIGVREQDLRIKFRRLRGWYLIYAARRLKGGRWETELVHSFSGCTDHLFLPQRGKVYKIKVVRKGSCIRLYQGSKLVAQGSHSAFNKGRVTIRARGDRGYDGFLITSIKITGRIDPDWLKEQKERLAKKADAVLKRIDRVVREVKKRIRGVTRRDEEKMRKTLSAAREFGEQAFNRLCDRYKKAKNLTQLRKRIKKAEDRYGKRIADLDEVIKAIEENCKGLTEKDKERIRSLLKDAKRLSPLAYERLRNELLKASNWKELRRILDEAERIRDRWKRWKPAIPPSGKWKPGR